jgi:hypothetical protein
MSSPFPVRKRNALGKTKFNESSGPAEIRRKSKSLFLR